MKTDKNKHMKDNAWIGEPCFPVPSRPEKTDSGIAPSVKYPNQYLHVEECRSGETWIQPFGADGLLDIEHNVKLWIQHEFCGELELDGELMPRLAGEYYAKIITDGRAPDSVVVWQSGGFYLKNV